MKKTAIYGGSFDPPHKGHTEIITQLSGIFDRVVVVPAFISPFKQGQKQVSAEDRLHMLSLAIPKTAKNNIEISSYEIDKGGVSFTYDTIKHFAKPSGGQSCEPSCGPSGGQSCEPSGGQFCEPSGGQSCEPSCEPSEKENRIYFVTGSESVCTLHLWKNADLLKKEATFFVVPREGYPHRTRPDFSMETAPFSVQDYSSSLFKAAHAFGFSRDLVGEKVFDYINKKGLYRDYFPLVEGFGAFGLSESRIKHTYRAVKAGIVLSKIHGEPLDKVITALTLHDIAKNTTCADMIACGVRPSDTAGIPTDCRHAVWGADIARDYYKIADADIINAIRFHTTGRPRMSRLEMIVALADYVEEGREFFGREEVFEAAKKDLNSAMADMLTRVMEYLSKTDREIFDVSLKALEYYKTL